MNSLRTLKIALVLVCLVAFCLAVLLVGELYRHAANQMRDIRSEGRLAQIAFALEIYHDDRRAFPPTRYQPVADGPVHSWRVLLFPIYRNPQVTADYSQMWNSPKNVETLGQMAPGFWRFDGEGETTHYLAIGEGDEWPTSKPLRSRLVTKGKDRFLLVEYPDSNIHWMEPRY